jgi:hypothetical protein
MVQSRMTCIALYTESEYEELILEAHVHCRLDEVNGHGRRKWICKYCRKDNWKDKNDLSWHRVQDNCPKWKGPGSLKIYPSFEKGDHTVLAKLMKKYGYDMDGKPVVVEKGVRLQGFGKGKAAYGEGAVLMQGKKRDAAIENEDGRKKYRRLLKHVEDQSDETETVTVAMELPKPRVSIAVPLRRSARSTEHRPEEAARSLQASTHPSTKPVVPLKKNSPPAPVQCAVPTRESVEAAARVEAATFTVQDRCGVSPPPTEVSIPALYHLISEPEEGVVDRKLLQDADACVSELGKVDISHGGLQVRIEKAFFSWFSDISYQVSFVLLV